MKETLTQQLAKITDPRARAAFRNANWKALSGESQVNETFRAHGMVSPLDAPRKSLRAQLEEIQDPAARAAFRRDNWTALLNEATNQGKPSASRAQASPVLDDASIRKLLRARVA
jgi:hypothetical protein